MLRKLAVLCLFMLAVSGCSKPPAKEQVHQAVGKIISVPFEVLQVSELKEIRGLYEVVITVGKNPVVLYVDKKAKYVVAGNVMSTETGTDLTAEAQKRFQKK